MNKKTSLKEWKYENILLGYNKTLKENALLQKRSHKNIF